jgi:predicted RNA-binding Zn-ribbon protein involved in translation (DUF1610 family)
MIDTSDAIAELKEIRFNLNCRVNGTSRFDDALDLAIKALAQNTVVECPTCNASVHPKYRCPNCGNDIVN